MPFIRIWRLVPIYLWNSSKFLWLKWYFQFFPLWQEKYICKIQRWVIDPILWVDSWMTANELEWELELQFTQNFWAELEWELNFLKKLQFTPNSPSIHHQFTYFFKQNCMWKKFQTFPSFININFSVFKERL